MATYHTSRAPKSSTNPNPLIIPPLETHKETWIILHGRGSNAQNVILGSLSQGCAAALVATLLWDGEPLAAAFGMCGWLPYRGHMQDIAEAVDNGDDDDLFAQAETDEAQPSRVDQAVRYLREELDLPEVGDCHPFQRIPIFLGHGVEDEKVPVGLGEEAASCLRSLQGSVDFKTYEDLGHWYSGAMLRDILNFVKER